MDTKQMSNSFSGQLGFSDGNTYYSTNGSNESDDPESYFSVSMTRGHQLLSTKPNHS